MDVIREVLIRGKMEIIKADLAAPDITAFTKQLQEQNQYAQQQAKFLADLIEREKERDAAAAAQAAKDAQRRAEESKAREERKKEVEEAKKAREAAAAAAAAAAAEAKKKADAERAAAEEAANAAKAAEAAAKAEADAVRQAEQAKQDAIEATARAQEESARSSREFNDLLLKGGDALKQTTDGAFALARGLTLVSLSGTADLERIARKVADLQGKFDILRGSVDFIKGTAESTRAFGSALEKAGGASVVLSRGLASAAQAAAPLVATLGPAGAIALGIGAIAVASAAAWKAFSDNAQKAADEAIAALRRASEESGRIARERDLSQTDAKLGAAVATAQDRLAIARATGSDAEQEKARQELANTRIRAAQERERKLREQAADPRLTDIERAENTTSIIEAGGLVAQARRGSLLESADVRGGALRKQREDADRLLKEQRRLEAEREELLPSIDIGRFGSDEYTQAAQRIDEIDRRVATIQEKNPAEKLAEAVNSLVELQETTNEQIESLNAQIELAKSRAEQNRAYTARLAALQEEGQP